MNRFFKYLDIKQGSTSNKDGFSIIELLVVLAVIALLVVIAIPALNAMQKSFDSGGAESMISAALATARTLAIKNGHYAGVRFQKAGDPNDAIKADQYMIFISYGGSDQTDWVCGYIAVEGYKPIKLPENISVIDRIIWPGRSLSDHCGSTCIDNSLATPAELGNNVNIVDISTFSVIFSPSGKLVSQIVRCAHKNSGNDEIFNDLPTGMFVEDKHADSGIAVENSRRKFWIYDRQKFEKMTTATQRWDYLKDLLALHINPYTGEIIK